jgi:hypothetical protein
LTLGFVGCSVFKEHYVAMATLLIYHIANYMSTFILKINFLKVQQRRLYRLTLVATFCQIKKTRRLPSLKGEGRAVVALMR